MVARGKNTFQVIEMPDDDGFERDLVNGLNDQKNEFDQYLAYRRKQHRFSSQDIDVLVDSKFDEYYTGIECKSKQIDVDKAEKDNNKSEATLYFSDAFSKNQEGKHQIERISKFITMTGRTGYLAIAYRRGIGRSVHYWGIHWSHVEKLYYSDKPGIPRDYVREHGVLLMETDEETDIGRKTDQDFKKIFKCEPR